MDGSSIYEGDQQMRKRNVVSGSPIWLPYGQRVPLCGAAVCSIGIVPFLYKSKARARAVIKVGIATTWVCCIFMSGGFAPSFMA